MILITKGGAIGHIILITHSLYATIHEVVTVIEVIVDDFSIERVVPIVMIILEVIVL